MTAMSSRLPLRSASDALLLADSRGRRDRPIFVAAVALAALAHLIVLVVPLPRGAQAMPPAEPEPTFTVTPVYIPPPPPPDVPTVSTGSLPRRDLIPMDLAPDDSPVEEPAQLSDSELVLDDWDEFDPSQVAAPPEILPAVFDVTREGLIRPVRQPGAAEPDYPQMAVLISREGKVVLRATINAEGKVEQIEVLRAPDPDMGFSDAAIEAVSSWRYSPGIFRGKPVAVSLTVVVDFHLDR